LYEFESKRIKNGVSLRDQLLRLSTNVPIFQWKISLPKRTMSDSKFVFLDVILWNQMYRPRRRARVAHGARFRGPYGTAKKRSLGNPGTGNTKISPGLIYGGRDCTVGPSKRIDSEFDLVLLSSKNCPRISIFRKQI